MSSPVTGDARPLHYIVEALRQIVETVRDFGLEDAAQHLERARLDIEKTLPKRHNDYDVR